MRKEIFQLRLLRCDETGEYSLTMLSSDSRFAPPPELSFGKEGSKVAEAILNLLSMDATAALAAAVEETKVPDES